MFKIQNIALGGKTRWVGAAIIAALSAAEYLELLPVGKGARLLEFLAAIGLYVAPSPVVRTGPAEGGAK